MIGASIAEVEREVDKTQQAIERALARAAELDSWVEWVQGLLVKSDAPVVAVTNVLTYATGQLQKQQGLVAKLQRELQIARQRLQDLRTVRGFASGR